MLVINCFSYFVCSGCLPDSLQPGFWSQRKKKLHPPLQCLIGGSLDLLLFCGHIFILYQPNKITAPRTSSGITIDCDSDCTFPGFIIDYVSDCTSPRNTVEPVSECTSPGINNNHVSNRTTPGGIIDYVSNCISPRIVVDHVSDCTFARIITHWIADSTPKIIGCTPVNWCQSVLLPCNGLSLQKYFPIYEANKEIGAQCIACEMGCND